MTIRCLILFLVLAPGIVHAQSTDRVDAYFRVVGGYRIKDTSFVIITGGTKFGVKAGEAAFAFSTYKEEPGNTRPHVNIGYGRVVRAFPDSSVCIINQVKTATLYDSVLIGDLVKTKIDLPRKKYPTVFLSLALLNCWFKDADKQVIWNLRALYDLDSPSLDSLVVDFLRKDLKANLIKYKDQFSKGELAKPISRGGRYAGRFPMKLMEEATEKDVMSYLAYVQSYPAKYMGKDFSFGETFITWAMFSAGYGPAEIVAALLPVYDDPVRLKAALQEYEQSIRDENLIGTFADSISITSQRGDFALAEKYSKFCMTLATVLKDTGGRSDVMAAMMTMESQRYNYNKAVAYGDSAILYARLVKSYERELTAYLYKSQNLVLIPKIEEGVKVLNEMEQRIAYYRNEMPADRHLYFSQLHSQYKAWAYYTAKNYAKAIEQYTATSELYKKGDRTYTSRSNVALVYKKLGQIYKDQGRNQDAIRSFASAALIYDSINYIADKAWIWNEIGAAHYNNGNYPEAMKWFEQASDVNRRLGSKDNLGYGVSMKANCYWMLGKVDSAIMLHKEAINIRRDVNALGTAYSWDQLGQLYKENAYKTKALEAYDSSRAIYEALKDSANLSDNFLNVGLVYHGDENYRKAISYYQKSVGITTKPSAAALFDLGLAWGSLQRKKGIEYFERAERITNETKDLALLFKTLNFMALDNYTLNEIAKGDAAYSKMEKLMKEIGTPARQASLYTVRAEKQYKKGELDSALSSYKMALAIQDTVSKSDAVSTMLYISNVLTTKGEFEEAIRWIEKALMYSRMTGSPLGEGVSYNNLGFVYGELGDLDRGMAAMDSAASIFKRSGNNLRYASAMIQRGMLFKNKGEFKTGLEQILYADSVYIAEEALDNRRVSLNNAGVVYFNQSDYNKAIEFFSSSEQYFDKAEIDENLLINRANIAECYYHQKKYKEAKAIMDDYYPRAVKMGFRRIATSMANIQAKMYFEIGDLARAEKYAGEAYEFSSASGAIEQLVEAMVMKGKVSAGKRDMVSAEKLMYAAVEKSNSSSAKGSKWIVYYEMGLVYYQQAKYDSAISNFSRAVEIVERNAGNIFGGEEARKLYTADARKVDLYNKIIASYVAKKDPAKASEYALRNSITAINSKYGQDLGFADSTLKADLARAEEYQRQISVVNVSIAEAKTPEKKEALLKTKRILEEGYQNFLDERKENNNDFQKFLRGGVNPEDFSNYKGGLPEDIAVISFVVNDGILYKFIVTNSTLEIATTTLVRDINEMVNEFISSLTTPDSASGTGSLKVRAEFVNSQQVAAKPFRQTSEALYHVLIEDILPVIGNKKKLCIIPSGKLSNIPFQCLGRMQAGKFRFLLEDHKVFYTNRMDMFRSNEGADRDMSNMAAFGNPDKSLAYAKKEVLDIQKIAGARQVLIEDKATEQEARLALGQRKYIHFATHGTLDYVKPKQSFLTFTASPGGLDDGRLTISEIDSLKAPGQYAEMITLSACETASPMAISDDWYVSPANSFLRKKFKTVVASLWQVNDEATGLLMTEFYKNLETMDKVDALRMAQQKVSSNPKYTHPYYWGGFVLYGDWR